jgi:hypothetical protein
MTCRLLRSLFCMQRCGGRANQRALLPADVALRWDFRPKRVCGVTAAYLQVRT